jgi:hypothetical protein
VGRAAVIRQPIYMAAAERPPRILDGANGCDRRPDSDIIYTEQTNRGLRTRKGSFIYVPVVTSVASQMRGAGLNSRLCHTYMPLSPQRSSTVLNWVVQAEYHGTMFSSDRIKP